MPVIDTSWNYSKFNKLKKQIRLIKKHSLDKKILPNLFINECISKEYSNITKLSDKTSCGCGSKIFCVDFDGIFYSCFIPAGLPKRVKSNFISGNLNKGIIFKENVIGNRYLGCPVWFYLYDNISLNIYRQIYNIWRGNEI